MDPRHSNIAFFEPIFKKKKLEPKLVFLKKRRKEITKEKMKIIYNLAKLQNLCDHIVFLRM